MSVLCAHGTGYSTEGRPEPAHREIVSGWRKEAGLAQVRVHDLKHTLGRRLRAAGVGFEDRQDLLGHRSGRITTLCSSAVLYRLLEAIELVVSEEGSHKVIGDLNQVKEATVGYAKFTQWCSFASLGVWIPDQKTSGMTPAGWLRNGGGERLRAD